MGDFVARLTNETIREAFYESEMDGQALLLMTQEHLRDTMKIKLGPSLIIASEITKLRERARTFSSWVELLFFFYGAFIRLDDSDILCSPVCHVYRYSIERASLNADILVFYVQIDIKDWGDVKIIKKISLNFRSDDDRFLSHYLHQQG